MKYFSIDSVLTSFESNKNKTSDGFWGIMSILLSLDCKIRPCKQYDLDCQKIATILEGWFSVRKSLRTYNTSATWYAVFSTQWEEQLSLFFKTNQTPNIYDIICWMYQDTSFENIPTNEELLSLFCKDTSIREEVLKSLFDMSKRDFSFSDSKFSHDLKIQKIVEIYGVVDNNNAIKSNGSYIVADAGAFQRAPFTQTLYASTENFKCLMITSSAPNIYYPDNFGEKPKSDSILEPLQVIYYGAPGTGKSHQTDKIVEWDKENKFHQRTTFHPDSDYSSFVGCYKPSKENGELTYKFIPQAFLNAYVAAWKNPQQPYYLIIEEINRGNCAQIFGDIFQLLDRREDGFSKYHITSDTDIATYLKDEAFKGMSAGELPTITDINTEQIISGEIMQLPSNLHIYATMNTSDQSLFPIDSAFKRRWEWEYKPIEQPNDVKFIDWKIVTDDGFAYDWWKFLTEVNNRIFDTTQSEDKKMGYWFTKADAQKRISQKKFIGKVLFYLWNDVFKDYARTENTVFKVFKDADKKETEEYTFTDFFRSDGVTERIHRLMFTLGIKREDWQEPFNPNGESDADIMPENPNEIVTYWSDFKQRLLEGPMKDVIGNYPIPKGPRFQTSLANNAGLTNTYILATTKLKTPNEKVTICAGFNTGKFASLKAFLKEHQNEFNAKVKELSDIEPNWNENQFSTTIYVAKDGIDMDWQVNNYQALYAYFSELLNEFKPNDEVTD